MKPNILFVDDEIDVLNAMKRNLRSRRNEWDLHYVNSAREAMDLMKSRRMDVLVTDIRMPDIDGVTLLEHTKALYPETLRLALTGQVEEQQFQKVISLAHRFLGKPCPADTVIDIIEKATASKALYQSVSCVFNVDELPSPPSTFQKLQTLINDPETDFVQISDVVSSDAAISVKLLKVVNSAFFGLSTKITSAADAAVYLGTSNLFSIATSLCLFREFDSAKLRAELEVLATHCFKVANASKKICLIEKAPKVAVDQAFTVGLLLATGKLVLLSKRPDEWFQAIELAESKGLSLCEAQQRVLGFDYLEIGAQLLDLWGLPLEVVEAIRLPCMEQQSDQTKGVTGCAAHFSNHLLETGIHDLEFGEIEQLLVNYNFCSRLEDWKIGVDEVRQIDD